MAWRIDRKQGVRVSEHAGDGSPLCRGTDGALGLNTSTNFNTPQQVGTLNTWQKIDAGGDHTIATRNGGSLWAFGRNLNGQLGDGTNIGKFIPIQISCGALATDSFESNSFKIYPNPANDKIFIQIPDFEYQ